MTTSILLFFSGIGAPEIIIILAVILLFFGGRKLPELAKGIGKGLKEFRNATKDDEEPKPTEDNSGSSE